MAYEPRLSWHTPSDFYAIEPSFIGDGGGLQYIDNKLAMHEAFVRIHVLFRVQSAEGFSRKLQSA